ncbi:SDR family NAD(P)-dependent oxidoreductase [Streptomyces sp. NPDC090075]|uniref:SDR family NAD(P)-dependent oxidoreductase n=1 Tax=Streptomyces sp. NPDC090075 TaxID=3365937 RepID=UPI0038007EA2
MPTIAIVGAGPGLGLSMAKVFGRNGFSVALVARTKKKLDSLAAELSESGIEAAGFAADVMDRPSLAAAFARIKERFGGIDVLEYSPASHNPEGGAEDHVGSATMTTPLNATAENIQPQLDYYLYGGIAAAQQVLSEMIDRDAGTLLFTTGGSSLDPLAGPPEFGNIAIATAALRAWVLKLNQVLDGTGVYAAHVPIFAWIGSGGPETQADTIAQRYWDIYTKREGAEHPYDIR